MKRGCVLLSGIYMLISSWHVAKRVCVKLKAKTYLFMFMALLQIYYMLNVDYYSELYLEAQTPHHSDQIQLITLMLAANHTHASSPLARSAWFECVESFSSLY